MKYFFVAAALVGTAFTQAVTDLPPCGQTCINGMLGQAEALGCSAADAACLCSNVRFGYGIRDCANEACQDQSNVPTIIAFGQQYCAGGE
ncbi:MAG: hypothetical protein M1823_007092, partial [Watsoniomyces obsoletus]